MIILVLCVTGFVYIFHAYTTTGPCGIYQQTTVVIGEISVVAQIADTACKQELGLSGRSGLAEGMGMLFVFGDEGAHGFWMKDMHFPIDMVWIDRALLVTGVEKNVQPASYPLVYGKNYNSAYVLELPAGFADAHDIMQGIHVEIIKQ